MNDSATPHRATILVGYGELGLDVLRRLLASTAPRGVLSWDEPRGGGGPSERHLQDLALLWLPDPLVAKSGQVGHDDAREGHALEMMRDLYRQIRAIDPRSPADAGLAEALVDAAETLLAAGGRAGRSGALPLGLDVIVVAQPASREVIGTLDRLIRPGMDQLANNANLRRAVQGSDPLNFVAIYDFENYWDRSEHGRGVRKALHASVEHWQRLRDQEKPAFGRFYLVDGRTDDGIREPFHRIDEISLFLEFLLFEGQRNGELRRLYQPLGQHELTVATFGIRLVERSAGLLASLAAARFGTGWLEYLAGTGPFRSAAEAEQLRQRLAPFGPDALDDLVDADALRSDVERGFTALEREVTALPPEMPDWPRRVRAAYERTLQDLEVKMSARAHALMANISRNHLVHLPTELRAGINADLGDAREPVAVGTAIAELERLLERLDELQQVAPTPPGASEDLLRDVEKLHQTYSQFHEERIDVEGLRRWWPLYALALAAGLTPLLTELLADIPPPDVTRFLLNRAHGLLQRVNNSLVVGTAAFTAAWSAGALGFHRSIAGRVDRARRFYSDERRGRFVDRLRAGLGRGGALRAPVEESIDRLLYNIHLSVRGEVTREVGLVLSRLRERRREMLWLRDQLREFLRMHGFTGDDLRPEEGRLDRNDAGIRHSMERGEDFEATLRSNPPGPERFRSTQAEEAPFREWEERYCRSFLVPLEFLERLSRIYKDPFQQELARPGKGPEQQRLERELLEFLRRRGRFALAFRFEAQEGLPPDQRYCLVPPMWKRLDGVERELADLRMSDKSILTGSDSGRAYLLRVQSGVDPRCLLELG
ncbi:MAG TPA: hypothetical protein VF846_07975 [Thermoanaerobaculia bacterium]|jgi:hypothetical protein